MHGVFDWALEEEVWSPARVETRLRVRMSTAPVSQVLQTITSDNQLQLNFMYWATTEKREKETEIERKKREKENEREVEQDKEIRR